ncbi:NUDIX domain-containing protein [Kribbella sp. NPDC051586]|uniref:NUDIX domain-containing protein n=1 Tax=Kribbella sp. NPDC051586 TaxID=3364118 RepID=UPI0037AC3BEC
MEPTTHFGIYALWQQDGHLVLVRKARGPYEGLLDLPGGSPEPTESESTTLHRELREECGVELTRTLASVTFEFHVPTDSSGHPINFTHTAAVSHVEVAGPVVQDIESEDVRGAVLATKAHTQLFSPLVTQALHHFPHLAGGATGTMLR